MPYESPADIPATVRRVLPPRAQRIWMEAFNSAVYDQGADDAKGARIAWGAVKNAGYVKGEGGMWQRKGKSTGSRHGGGYG